MDHNQFLEKIVREYYATRPNLNIALQPIAVLFLASSGSGKSTVRKQLVDALRYTYVCNDEVRELLNAYPEAIQLGINLKDVVEATRDKIINESMNKAIVFDNNIAMYYMHQDSYFNVAVRNNIPTFVIGIDMTLTRLEERVKARNVDTEHILSTLPTQLEAYRHAIQELKPNVIIREESTDNDIARIIKLLKSEY